MQYWSVVWSICDVIIFPYIELVESKKTIFPSRKSRACARNHICYLLQKKQCFLLSQNNANNSYIWFTQIRRPITIRVSIKESFWKAYVSLHVISDQNLLKRGLGKYCSRDKYLILPLEQLVLNSRGRDRDFDALEDQAVLSHMAIPEPQ